MDTSLQSRKLLLVVLLLVVLVLSVFVSLKLDFDNRDELFQNVIRDSPEGMQAFQKLAELTPLDAIVFAWWDYGRPIRDFGQRSAVVAYPSREIIQSVAASQNPFYAIEIQLFGTFEPTDKIHDVARAFLLPEDESLAIMEKYGATHVIVFHGEDRQGSFNDLQKFAWIARIAGYNASDYVQFNPASGTPAYELTSKAEQVTMLRLLFDEEFHPQHFTKLYENSVAKIYQIEYPASQSTRSSASLYAFPTVTLTPVAVPSVCESSTHGRSDPQHR